MNDGTRSMKFIANRLISAIFLIETRQNSFVDAFADFKWKSSLCEKFITSHLNRFRSTWIRWTNSNEIRSFCYEFLGQSTFSALKLLINEDRDELRWIWLSYVFREISVFVWRVAVLVVQCQKFVCFSYFEQFFEPFRVVGFRVLNKCRPDCRWILFKCRGKSCGEIFRFIENFYLDFGSTINLRENFFYFFRRSFLFDEQS